MTRWLGLLPACPSHDQVCLHPSCSPRQHGSPVLSRRPPSSVEHRHASDIRHSTPGASLRSGFRCPGASTLNRPHPPHSQVHHYFIALRLISDAFAVRERLGEARVVPRFTCSILPSRSSSTSPRAARAPIQFLRETRLPLPRAIQLGTPEVLRFRGLLVPDWYKLLS
jgi:hypothetical protein